MCIRGAFISKSEVDKANTSLRVARSNSFVLSKQGGGRMRRLFVTFCAAIALMVSVRAQQIEDLKAEVERLRAEMHEKAAQTPIVQADAACDCHYGPNEKVTTKDGKLSIGALVQVWYQNIQHDKNGIVVPASGNALPDAEPNNLNDNSTYRVRRTELRFTLEINQYINSCVMMDPARQSDILF